MKQELGINLLVYKDALEQGMTQSNLLEQIKRQGINLAEVRREYIKETKELENIQKQAKRLKMKICYSVPEKIMEYGMPHPNLITYLDEAKQMGAWNVKFNIGDLYDGKQEVMERLKNLLQKYEMSITIENDQTRENGTLNCTKKTLSKIREYQIPVGYTMDLGNWYWQKENPKEAFEQLRNQIQIFHLKNIVVKEEMPHTVLLEEGEIPWENMIEQLDEHVMVFLEYPMEEAAIKKQIEKVKNIG